MRTILFLTLLFVTSFGLVSVQKLCMNCYGEHNNQTQFLCHGQKCDAFYWPRNSPFPKNLQCSPATPTQPDSSCFILSGLDPTKQYHKFLSFSYLAQSNNSRIQFTFSQQDNTIIINADVENAKYQGHLMSHPEISFEDVKEALTSHQFKIVSRTVDLLKLKVGFYSMELKNTFTVSFNQLKNSIMDLTTKNAELQKQILTQKDQITTFTNKLNTFNNITERVTKVQNTDDELKAQFTRYNKRLIDLESFVTKQKNDMDSVNRQLTQATSKITQLEKINNDLKGKVSYLEKKIATIEKNSNQDQKKVDIMNSKILNIQQRISTSDQTTNQLRQMFGSVESRLGDFDRAFANQKSLIKKLSSKLATVTEGIEIIEQDSEIEPSPIQEVNTDASLENKSSPSTSAEPSPNTIQSLSLHEYPLHQVHKNSKVVNSIEEIETLERFFYPRKIIKLQLLYRASQNEYSAAMFHKKCDRIADSLVLSETEYGKKIGGFTPLVWDGSKNGEYKADQTGESFIFSLSNKDKFTLHQKNKAIWNHINYGPTFGSGADFSICDEAHEKIISYSDINKSYNHPAYKQREKDSYERFCGNPNNTWHFRVQEWEVWRVQFENFYASAG